MEISLREPSKKSPRPPSFDLTICGGMNRYRRREAGDGCRHQGGDFEHGKRREKSYQFSHGLGDGDAKAAAGSVKDDILAV